MFRTILLCLATCITADAAPLRIDKVEPPNWWVGMHHHSVQMMVYGQNLHGAKASFDDPRLRVVGQPRVDNPHFLFVDVEIPPDLIAGVYELRLQSADSHTSIQFPILQRERTPGRHQGFGPEDTIYLITPDRFANGDSSNDRVEGVLDDYDPSEHRMRHGGDLRGIIDHLDYLQDLGVTAIWLNPVLENNGVNSYHGYKPTDLYKIDPRFGSNATYKELVTAAHRRGMKVIFDHVNNHIGIRHPWIEDLPEEDWLNGSVENHLSEKHFLLSITDPHADAISRQQLKSFWFVDKMPDLNQRNPLLAKYLIQNTIWWIEYSGLDGIREDTYPYADQSFLANWAQAIRKEYPNFNIVGEIWATQPAYIAHFQEKTILPRAFETHLPAVMDFPLMQAFRNFLDGTGKLRDIHAVYAQDFLYTDVNNLLVFLDNHDTARAIYHAKGDRDRVKLALTIMLTGRGIPQILYGTEIGMLGGKSHVELRANFPGGFPGHDRDAFRHESRTADENEMHTFVKQLLQLRRTHSALTKGSMIHWAPTWNNDVYQMLRIHGDEKILVVANGQDEPRHVQLPSLAHHLKGRKLRDLFTGETSDPADGIDLRKMSARLFRASRAH